MTTTLEPSTATERLATAKRRRRPGRSGWTTFLLGLPVPILFVLLWQFGRAGEWELPFGIRMAFLPYPGDVLVSLIDYAFAGLRNDAFSGLLWTDLGASAGRVFGGFALATVLAVPLGVLMGRYYVVNSLFDPFINLFRPVPATAWVPLVALLIGYGDQASIFLITLSAFFPIVLGTISGARQVPPRLIEAARMLGTGTAGVLARVVLPASAAAIVNGMRVGLGLAWVVLVLSETTGVSTGLGSTIFLARDVVRTDLIVVGMICIAIAGFASDRLLLLVFRLLFGRRPLIS
ncbi:MULTISPECIES: ABC transporter permease [Rathayibacter]|uniref:ABC transporter permease n=1 Tax=Rathayibacter TaxID=33886 RepID=UPI0006FC0779|nr:MULTISPECIES: ABC transporter permease [Rathayibacter]KQQ09946.1 ABC transporter permease [Rathayibacter sp. Leaf296]KQQ22180.1 ABC transporter permease [Rathayibacter sp. Leaf299]MCJ1695737.1 ABC transporter permease [Rathayibacter caricis]